ncbi:MAG TPA: ATP-binding cassette domain-containing protein [Fimbriimonadaceae bacterium]|nr:ATP-binding cassette domain-containing protein [Fimbriimonadaceae bacterium]
MADIPRSRSSILEVRGLTRRFDGFIAVDHVTFSVGEGEVLGLVGLNGAGKTTLIKMLITLLPPSEGSAVVCGYDLRREPAMVRRTIGYVPQLVSVDGDLTGRENLQIYARLYDVPGAERASRVDQALRFMDLADVGDKLVRAYSGGMVRRLEIAQSMLHRPHLLFLDEPTFGLDPVARASVWRHILELRNNFGATILLTTHLLDEVEELCDRMAIMTHGKLAAIGTVEELRQQVGPDAPLDEVFVHFAGTHEQEGEFRAAARLRRTGRRLG